MVPSSFEQASELGLEGIICKRRDGPYTAGRSPDWLKVKSSHREEFVIGGFTDPGVAWRLRRAAARVSRSRTTSCSMPAKSAPALPTSCLASLRKRLDTIDAGRVAFCRSCAGTTGEARGAHWVRPQLVAKSHSPNGPAVGICAIRRFWGFARISRQVWWCATLRSASATSQVSRTAAQTHAVKPAAAQPSRALVTTGTDGEGTLAGVRLTSPDKVLFEEDDITKLELAQYYLSVARWILPHVANRPLSLVRCPEGSSARMFLSKASRRRNA